MKFCPKCKALMIQKDGKWVCPKCGYTEKIKDEKFIFKEKKEHKETVTVIEEKPDVLPVVEDVVCPKCGNRGAYFWTMQTRAGDEAETKFYRCTKCGYTWRVYE